MEREFLEGAIRLLDKIKRLGKDKDVVSDTIDVLESCTDYEEPVMITITIPNGESAIKKEFSISSYKLIHILKSEHSHLELEIDELEDQFSNL